MLAVVLGVVGIGCCPQLAELQSHAPVRRPAPRIGVLAPSPMLQLVRAERLAASGPLAPTPGLRARARPRRAAARGTAEPEPRAEVTDGEVRQIHVSTSRLATPEALVRSMLRHAESRRPRALYTTRLLVRPSGPACCTGEAGERTRVRALANATLERARPAIRSCLADELASDPSVLLKAPSLLVVEQVHARGPVVYRFVLAMDVGPAGVDLVAVRGPQAMTPRLRRCIGAAIRDDAHDVADVRGQHRVELPVIAFSQPGWGKHLRSLHHGMALQAATIGWIHYERREFQDALEYFRDAYWLFHLEEFRYLTALAHEQLGNAVAAADDYEAFAAARPYAPEASTLPAKVFALRRAAARRRDAGP